MILKTRASKWIGFLILAAFGLCNRASPETILFLAAEFTTPPIHTDSYVLPLSRPEHLEHARDLIARGPVINGELNHPVPVARIAAGRDGINRNMLAPDRREWSWHVVRVLGFSDGCGWCFAPAEVEEDVAAYIANTSGLIDFGSYTVVAELGPALSVSAQLGSEGLALQWPDISTNEVYTVYGSNFVYTLESKDSLGGTNWQPVEGFSWPSKARAVSLPLPLSTTRFYRVRAELRPP